MRVHIDLHQDRRHLSEDVLGVMHFAASVVRGMQDFTRADVLDVATKAAATCVHDPEFQDAFNRFVRVLVIEAITDILTQMLTADDN